MVKNLVIVESPAKARTLSKILGKSYSLKASLGHVRDLPKSRLGVDIEHDFEPKYVVSKDKKKIVAELQEAVKTASTIYLATDPDREGEAIAWHLEEVTKTDRKLYRRVVFHEITEEAIEQAFKHPRSIDMQLVNAQQARRVLDRLVGYKISPLLWKKLQRGLSAGRVQSVALRIIVDREREIEKFVKVEYWSINADLAKAADGKSGVFRAALVSLFDGTKLEIHHEAEATRLGEELKQSDFSVATVKTKTAVRQPAPPFITSTLQQEAWRKLHYTAEKTMAVAQQLYEGLPVGSEGSVGLITYMRTDSTHVASSAIAETRDFIGSKYGAEFLPPHARAFVRKVKGAQEAHEAIRPTKIHREPQNIKSYLTGDQFRLYDLIWKRMVASQMSAATFDNTTVDIKARCAQSRTDYLLRTATSVLKFPGFTRLYTEGKDEVENEEKASLLPKLEKGDGLKLIKLFPEQHFTQPPPRFTEATLIKTLEQNGIGRPSTYAPTISTLRERKYIVRAEGSLKPTELGMTVTDLLIQYFPDIVDIKFTARMEDELDEIVTKNTKWASVVKDFYTPFEKSLQNAALIPDKVAQVTDEVCPKCGKPLVIKEGRFGKFLACSGYPECKFTRPIDKEKSEEPTGEACPKCGKPIVIKGGRFGKFMACSGYPECKFTKPIQIKIGVKCPDCGGEMLEKVSKKKRTFYSCSNYPNCKFATFFRPLPQPCPQCGQLLRPYREKWAKCTKCDYKGKIEELAK